MTTQGDVQIANANGSMIITNMNQARGRGQGTVISKQDAFKGVILLLEIKYTNLVIQCTMCYGMILRMILFVHNTAGNYISPSMNFVNWSIHEHNPVMCFHNERALPCMLITPATSGLL